MVGCARMEESGWGYPRVEPSWTPGKLSASDGLYKGGSGFAKTNPMLRKLNTDATTMSGAFLKGEEHRYGLKTWKGD